MPNQRQSEVTSRNIKYLGTRNLRLMLSIPTTFLIFSSLLYYFCHLLGLAFWLEDFPLPRHTEKKYV